MPAAENKCSALLDCGLEHTRAGFQVEELEDAGRREPLWQVNMWIIWLTNANVADRICAATAKYQTECAICNLTA